MRVRLAEHMGLCFGVRRALEMTEKSLSESPEVYAFGDLLHNPHEMDRLRGMGLKYADSLEDVPGGTIILRTHGSAPSVQTKAKKRGLRVVDSTCPHVKAAQKAAQMLAKQGHRVIIVGDAGHPEVQSVLEWAGEGACVIKDASEAHGLEGTKFGVVSQTTEQRGTIEAVVLALRQKGEVKLVNTICTATHDRQQAVSKLAEQVNTLIVVGGRNSANTRQLARIAEEHGATTYLVERASEIMGSWLAGLTEIGVAAGASTPDWIIKEVVSLLEEANKPEPAPAPAPEREPETQDQEKEDSGGLKSPAVGDIVQATVVSVDNDAAMVDVGYKSEGIIPRKELTKKPDISPLDVVKPGDIIHAMVTDLETGEGAMRLSKRKAEDVLAWKRAQEVLDSGQTVEATVTEQVKGGLVVDIGLRGFVPASQVDRGFASDLSKYVGQTLTFKVIELDKSKNRIILSRRQALEEEAEVLKKEAWAKLQPGQEIKGTVKSFTDFGAFVDLGGVDGLLHVSELSFGRVKHPSDVLTIGQEISVKVLSCDAEKGRISLGYKHNLSDPWLAAAQKYHEGTTAKGKVTRIAPFGAFVELEEGLEGLIHISELSNKRVNKVEEVVTPGKEIEARVLLVKPEERRISLSMKEAEFIMPKKEQKPRKEQHHVPAEQNDKITLGDIFGDKLRQAFSEKKK